MLLLRFARVHARFGRSRRPGEGSWRCVVGSGTSGTESGRGAVFSMARRVSRLWHCVAGNLCGRLILHSIAIAVASEGSRKGI
jgi:hypothetical protein